MKFGFSKLLRAGLWTLLGSAALAQAQVSPGISPNFVACSRNHLQSLLFREAPPQVRASAARVTPSFSREPTRDVFEASPRAQSLRMPPIGASARGQDFRFGVKGTASGSGGSARALPPSLSLTERLDSILPSESGSLEASLPGITRQIDDIINEGHREYREVARDYFAEQGNLITVDELVRQLAARRQLVAHRLRDLANEHVEHRALNEALLHAALKIDLSEHERRTMDTRAEEFAGQLFDHENFTPRADRSFLGMVYNQMRGAEGELLTELRLRGPVRRDTHVYSLPDAARLLRPSELNREFDLMTPERIMEVKNYTHVMTLKHVGWPKILDQARTCSRIANKLGLPQRMEIIFLKGVSRDARAELEKLGLKVYGDHYEN